MARMAIHRARAVLIIAILAAPILAMTQSTPSDSPVSARAKQIHDRAIVVDTHDDTTQRLLDPAFDIGTRDAIGNIDIPRMREGGLDALFFSIWLPGDIVGPV